MKETYEELNLPVPYSEYEEIMEEINEEFVRFKGWTNEEIETVNFINEVYEFLLCETRFTQCYGSCWKVVKTFPTNLREDMRLQIFTQLWGEKND